MKFKDFKCETKKILNQYFFRIKNLHKRGHLNFTNPIYFPNLILCIETVNHFAFELLGSTYNFDNLIIKKHKVNSIEEYLYQFRINQSGKSLISLEGSSGLSNLWLSSKVDEEKVRERFPFIGDEPRSHLFGTNVTGSVLSFDNKFTSCFLSDCVLINRKDDIYRLKKSAISTYR